MIFTIALAQLIPGETIADNVKKGIAACEEAKRNGAHLILFPEMWLIGYDQDKMINEYAVDEENEAMTLFCQKARDLDMAIALTYLGHGKKSPTNNLTLINRDGSIAYTYRKVHICSFEGGTEITLEAGDEFSVATFSFQEDVVTIGSMICYDREHPESARTLMRKGADIIITPNACNVVNNDELGDVQFQQFRVRAFENMVGVAMTNYPNPLYDGHSCAFGPDGKKIVCASTQEEVVYACFDMDSIRQWRKKEVWGDVRLRPETYL